MKTFKSNAVPLRTLRLRSGLNQRDVAKILGFLSDTPVSRHERAATIPDLRTALAYEIIFRVPICDQFQRLFRSIEPLVEARIAELEASLQQRVVKGRDGARTARKLEFFWERSNLEID
jgi:transcriptional regulator with XRE-family HTH domain